MGRRTVLALVSVAVLAGVVGTVTSERARTALQSPRVLLTLALVGVVSLGALVAVRRRGASWPVALGAGAVPALVAAVVLVAPYFQARTVNEELPQAAPPSAAGSASASASESESPPAAVRLAGGRLGGLGGHRAAGQVALYRLGDGSRIVRFEGVDIEGTPTPRVYLVAGADRERPGGHAAGALKAEKGSFHYTVPGSLSGTFTVLVWCERFAVPIAGATLTV